MNEEGEKSPLDFGVIGKILITFGILWLISYLAVRWLVIASGGGRDIYGIWLFVPDRILEIIAISAVFVFSGMILYFSGIGMMKIGKQE